MFRSEVSDGVVPQVGRSKYHIVGPAVAFSAGVRLKKDFLFITGMYKADSPLLATFNN